MKYNIKTTKIIILVSTAILALPFVIYGIDYFLNKDRIHYGIKIGEQNFGGYSKEEALDKLNKLNAILTSMPAVLVYDEQSWEIDPKKIKARIKIKKAVEEALKVGNEGTISKRVRERLNSWLGNHEVKLDLSADKEKVKELIDKIAASIDKKALNPTVVVKDGKAIPVQGQTGLLLSRTQTEKSIAKAITSPKNKRTHKLPVLIIPTSIKYSNALSVAKKANIMISAPLTVKYIDKQWEISKSELIDLIKVEEAKVGVQKELVASIDGEKFKAKIELLTKHLTREPQEAKFSVSGDKVLIIPSKEGIAINLEKAAEDINIAAAKESSTGAREMQLSSIITQPNLTTEKAQSMGIKEKISSFTTTYSSLATARVNNIHLLTRTLDGTILAPGEVFSFNKTIGPRTAAKGYKEAPVILNGKLVPGLGGGVCQVATTMFNTIFFSGLPVVERRNHSFYISKYPTGRDAVVSYPYPDLKFKNDTGAHILIKGSLTSTSVTIAFYGTDPKRKVTYSTTGFSNITAFPIERNPDPTLEQGVERIIDNGETGKQVTVYRTVSKDGKVMFKDTFVSKYRPKIQVVNFGTKPPKVIPTTSTEQTPL